MKRFRKALRQGTEDKNRDAIKGFLASRSKKQDESAAESATGADADGGEADEQIRSEQPRGKTESTEASQVNLYEKTHSKGREILGTLPWVVGFILVAGSALFVYWRLQPHLIFRNNTPTGGDMGAHVWGPQYLKDHMWSWGRLTGWAPDWYAGFPAFHFYMVIPYLAIVLLSYLPLISYGVAFKVVAVSGAVLLPVAAWACARLMRLRFPMPALFALATLPFLFNDIGARSEAGGIHAHIWGGNLTSLLAGEFASVIALSLSFLAFGIAYHGIHKGGYRIVGAIVIALVGLCHLIMALFVLGGLLILVLVHKNRGAAARWFAVVLPLAGLLGAFWALPFWARRDYFNDMGWERTGFYWEILFQDNWRWMIVLAAAGATATIIYRIRLGWFLIGNLVLWASAFRWLRLPGGRLWNARLTPFYNISLWLLAALGVAVLIWRLFGRNMRGLFAEGVREEAAQETAGRELALKWYDILTYGVTLVGLVILLLNLALPLWLDLILLVVWLIVILLRHLGRYITDPMKKFYGKFGDYVYYGSFAVVGALAAIYAIDSYFGSGFAEWSIQTFISTSGSEAERLAGEFSTLIRLLVWGGLIFAGVELVQHWLRIYRLSERSGRELVAVGVLVVSLVFFVSLATPLRALGWFGERGFVEIEAEDKDGNPVLDENGLATTENKEYYAFKPPGFGHMYQFTHKNDKEAFNVVPYWATYNFTGYEARPGYGEYTEMLRTMKNVGRDYGCGRAMWEYDKDVLGEYGTPMAPMLLPYWSDGCIDSMEGLYFESSATVPYHFLNQSELSEGPSRAMRPIQYGDLNIYSPVDVPRGVEHLQLMGARYYMAISESIVTDARAHPDLTEIAVSGPWTIFLVEDTELVTSLEYEPVVWNGIGNGQEDWLPHSAIFYNSFDHSVFPAASGPEQWTRVPPGEQNLPRKALPSVEVSNIETSDDSISFSVDRVGYPVLVKISYFPNWQASGADGPWRVAPNLMVVIPTSENVTLSYGQTPVDILAYTLTGAGVLIIALLLWKPSAIPWGRNPVRVRKTRR